MDDKRPNVVANSIIWLDVFKAFLQISEMSRSVENRAGLNVVF